LLGVHLRYGLHTCAVTIDRDTLSEGFSHFVSSIAAPVASGWSGCRVGLAPTGKRRLFTAHTQFRHRARLLTEDVAKSFSHSLTHRCRFDILDGRRAIEDLVKPNSHTHGQTPQRKEIHGYVAIAAVAASRLAQAASLKA